eukprot:gnl/Hemi2/4568_TR1581_c0_g1_i1.p1 gnl/Hemi2/4568_TR1581_c0_g1~~gnl/Hemi2/4568_TR1581_c0_g1_i1.p1  ORF type:complete len:168 (-),score=31.98 gnl/Hemi2/4568_TR1581_c0_g1_i1:61-564(-)
MSSYWHMAWAALRRMLYSSAAEEEALTEVGSQQEDPRKALGLDRVSHPKENFAGASEQDRHASEAVVRHHHQLQDEIATDILTQLEAFKTKSMSIRDALREEKKTLKDMEDVTSSNVDKVLSEKNRMEVLAGKLWNTTLTNYGMLLAVVVLFVAMFIFMKMFPKVDR